jgi:hypothetical protein
MDKTIKIRIEAKQGNFMLSKVYDIETGLLIPVRSVKIDMNVDNWKDGIFATIEVPVTEIEMDNITAKVIENNGD